MVEMQIVFCPKCQARVFYYDGKRTINIKTVCRKCGTSVHFDVNTGVVKCVSKTNRNTSSGLRLN